MKISETPWGHCPDGPPVRLFTLENAHGHTIKLTDFGATLVSWIAPDGHGTTSNIVLGHSSLSGMLNDNAFLGSTIGRFANRIAAGRFELDGSTYALARNDDENHLHGGPCGFGRLVWTAEALSSNGEVGVRFSRTSPDGEESYPGDLQIAVTMMLTDDGQFRLGYRATTDAKTVINLTNHAYFNLGKPGSSIRDHELSIDADEILEFEHQLPTGKTMRVDGSPFDFREPTCMGARLDSVPGGYDHCYLLGGVTEQPRAVASVVHRETKRRLDVSTTEPGVQFYSGNHLAGAPEQAGNPQHSGFCLETQHYPDSPNHPEFPSTVLVPGEEFYSETIYRLSVVE